jgi:hypothetical protein
MAIHMPSRILAGRLLFSYPLKSACQQLLLWWLQLDESIDPEFDKMNLDSNCSR